MLALLRGVSVAFGNSALDSEVDAAVVLPWVQREQHPLVLLPAEPARLEERDLGSAAAAPDGARPQTGHGRLRYPPRVGVVLQIERVELRVERSRRHVSMFVGNEKPRRPGAISRLRRSSRGSPPPLASYRLELCIGWVARGQLPPYLVQHPLPPCSQVPRQIRSRSWRLVITSAQRIDLHRLPIAMPQPSKLLAKRRPTGDSPSLQEPLHKPLVAQRELRQRPVLPRRSGADSAACNAE